MTGADNLHTRLRAAVEARLAVARAAVEAGPPWQLTDWSRQPWVIWVRANDPAATIRRCEALLRDLAAGEGIEVDG